MYISFRTKKIISRKLNIFSPKKKYTTIIRTCWATKYESRRENEFWGLAAVCLMHVDISS